MAITHVHQKQLAPFVDHLLIESPLRLDTLALTRFYKEYLYSEHGAKTDLFRIIRNNRNSYFYESLVLDNLYFEFGLLALDQDAKLILKMTEELKTLSQFLIKTTQHLKLYDPAGRIRFQSLDFFDSDTFILSKITCQDIHV